MVVFIMVISVVVAFVVVVFVKVVFDRVRIIAPILNCPNTVFNQKSLILTVYKNISPKKHLPI